MTPLKVSNKFSEIGIPLPAPGSDLGHGLFPIRPTQFIPLGLIVDNHVLVEVDLLQDTARWEKKP